MTITNEQITAAARALSDDNADVCNVNREDNWNFYGDSFRETARVALEAAMGVEPDADAGARDELASITRMFHAACADLGAINEALGLDSEDGGAEPIIDAINELKRERDQWVDANYALSASTEAAAGDPVEKATYVECRECKECGHVGINDSHETDAACGYSCGWQGPSPKDDKCPGCGHENVMSASCPKCSGLYSILAEAHVTALPAASGQKLTDEQIDERVIAALTTLGRPRLWSVVTFESGPYRVNKVSRDFHDFAEALLRASSATASDKEGQS